MKIVIAFITCFVLCTQPAHAMQPCMTSKLTKSEAMDKFDDIVVVKIKSSKDKTEWFLKQQREQHKKEPEELKKLEEYLMAYVTYNATVLENFKGSLEGEIKLAEVRHALSSFGATLVTGFYYVLGLDSNSSDGVIIMPGCPVISMGTSKFDGEFLRRVEEFRK